jgi:riboflavin synthase
MFSGIIEAVAKAKFSNGKLFVEKVIDVNLGDSVAVNGACLTVSDIRDYIVFDIGEETLKRTNLAKAKVVNLERALKLGYRIDGHLVTGHIDGTLKLKKILKRGKTYWLSFEMPKERFAIVEKGSIALNGISLTIAKVDKNQFWVQVIPYTWENTNLRFLRIGDEVNYEIDVVARYLKGILGDRYGLGKA